MENENQEKVIKKQEPETFDHMIRRAGKAQRTVEFQCPYVEDFFVKITFASKFNINQLRESSREVSVNSRTREREERTNEGKLRKEYARIIVHGWRGLTGRKLEKLLPGFNVPTEMLESDIPYNVPNTVALLEASMEFETWVLNTAMDLENYKAVDREKSKEFENLA